MFDLTVREKCNELRSFDRWRCRDVKVLECGRLLATGANAIFIDGKLDAGPPGTVCYASGEWISYTVYPWEEPNEKSPQTPEDPAEAEAS